jgi:2-polyprenyl-3-methyl-5-hydroxy-6-metoxy-1,4-benzoquinol methylase
MSAGEPIPRRTGDAIEIAGDYQHKALTQGPPIQRFWHHAKIGLLDWAFEVRPGERVVDVGCGSGVFAEALAGRGARVLGVDANEAAVAYATRAFGREGLEFRRGLLDELALPAASFDAATCLEVIELVYPDQVRTLLRSLFQHVRPGGRVLVTTPNYRGTWPVVEWLADRAGKTARMDADQHVTRFHARMLRRFLEQAGFRVDDLRAYCGLAPFVAGVSWKLAEALDRFERRLALPFQNLLVAVATRP